jgi:predicted membrane channel-forming protein YqfA (hemolysin III family)
MGIFAQLALVGLVTVGTATSLLTIGITGIAFKLAAVTSITERQIVKRAWRSAMLMFIGLACTITTIVTMPGEVANWAILPGFAWLMGCIGCAINIPETFDKLKEQATTDGEIRSIDSAPSRRAN